MAPTIVVGLWEAKRRFGPDIRGTLLIKQSSAALRSSLNPLRFCAVEQLRWNGATLTSDL